jgi:hypothetical protein
MFHSQLDQERKLSMKSFSFVLVLIAVSTVALAQPLPAGHPTTATKSEGNGVPDAQLPQKAKVLSSIDAAGYTYLEVTQNKKTLWIAGTKIAVKKGDVIRFDDGMVMTNFNSKTLNRTFPSVTFVNRVVVTKEKE